MNRRCCCLFILGLFAALGHLVAAKQGYNVLFIQSYNKQTTWDSRMIRGLKDGIKKNGIDANITIEYLDAASWTFNSEKVFLKRFCERARERKTDLIVTAGDEAFYGLFACGDSLPLQIPVVFWGIKYPDEKLIASLPNVCGFTSNPDFSAILQHANKIFPNRKEVICLIDNSFLSNKGKEDFVNEWEKFRVIHPDYTMRIYNTQKEAMQYIISAVYYSHSSKDRIVIVPKWSHLYSLIGKNSKAPFFTSQNLGLKNGVFCAYDADPYGSAYNAGKRAALVMKGSTPQALGVEEAMQTFIYDYEQLDYFQISSREVTHDGIIINEPYWEKHNLLFIILYSLVLILLTACIVWLIRINRREAKRRIHAQTRLLVQSKLIEQRNEFDSVLHSIRDGVITYDMDLRIHFTNSSLHQMLHLSEDYNTRPYEGMPAGSTFKIYNNGQDILHKMLLQVAETDQSVVIPSGSFMKEAHGDHYFLVSGEIAPIHTRGQITGMVLSARNISGEKVQERFFDMALEASAIYPWQFEIETENFTFPQGFLTFFGYDDSVTTISRTELDCMIHPDDLKDIRPSFNKILTGEVTTNRLNFRQRNAKGVYEWWEYRSSVINGLTDDLPYNILGVCQSIQRYKTVEQELRDARDEALRADKLKTAFLANMSHEIRTPLNAIVGFSDLLSDMNSFTQEEISQFIKTINKNCSLLLALINDILDLSRIESGTMEFLFAHHDLSLLLKTVYDSQRLNMPSGVELKLSIPEGSTKHVATDNVRLQQVVNNLINNAAKFTSSGAITFGYEEDEKLHYTTIFVEDTGIGITAEETKRIFERFYKIDSFTQGAGLGLSICQTIVERLKGEISVSSRLGKGTRFTVRIPNFHE